jgi:hypothetical protein
MMIAVMCPINWTLKNNRLIDDDHYVMAHRSSMVFPFVKILWKRKHNRLDHVTCRWCFLRLILFRRTGYWVGSFHSKYLFFFKNRKCKFSIQYGLYTWLQGPYTEGKCFYIAFATDYDIDTDFAMIDLQINKTGLINI